MSHTYTITLSDAQHKALTCVAKDPLEWIQNAAEARAQLVIQEIVTREVNRLLDAGLTIPSSKDEIVMNAEVKTVAELYEETRLRVEGQ